MMTESNKDKEIEDLRNLNKGYENIINNRIDLCDELQAQVDMLKERLGAIVHELRCIEMRYVSKLMAEDKIDVHATIKHLRGVALEVRGIAKQALERVNNMGENKMTEEQIQAEINEAIATGDYTLLEQMRNQQQGEE